ncbi:MAG: MFS transporter [Pseudomonadales bacterium]|nr:MFS transporter [Halieaceae bacterium]MCP5124003.1 MFS transporter [Pseudomonadales bacterium]
MNQDPQAIIDNSPMGRLQYIVIALCIVLLALDGFDVLAISFAAPGISEEWGISRGTLGIVLSMELAGMALGSVAIGGLADRHGRRPTILACLVVMSAGMLLAALADSILSLSLIRFATGLGIGGMLASVNAVAAEYANARRRSACVSLMAAGYPLGVIVGGAIASALLARFDWRAVFEFGALFTALLIPVTWILLPESVSFLLLRQPPRALQRVNATLGRMGHEQITALPRPAAGPARAGWGELFSPGLLRVTLLLTLAYLAHIMTFYFILKWIPKIVVDMGFTAAYAGSVLVWANVGGLAGSIVLSGLTQRFNVRVLVIAAMLGSVVMINIFGRGQADISELALVAACAGFFTNSAVVGLYAIFAQAFPTRVRAGGTGFVIGVGRGGAVLGPIVAGFLFESGQGLATVAFVMALGSAVAALMLVLLGERQA